jgi:uncharacterized protein (TIGR02145 family)
MKILNINPKILESCISRFRQFRKNVVKKSLYLIIFLLCSSAYGQSLSVFDVDTTNFPVMKAKFYALDNNWQQITGFNTSDFVIKENGIRRNVLSVSCPAPKPPEALSSILVMDASGSMGWAPMFNIDLAKEAGRAWVNGLPLGKSECGITSFSNISYLNQDYTISRADLLTAINNMSSIAGTNYDAALWDSPVSGIPICKTGKYKKVIVFLSDGQPNFEPQTQQIIDLALQNSIVIYAVTLNMTCPQCLKDISTQTAGKWFENVTTIEEARAIYLKILQMAQNSGEPCEITWESDYSCDRYRDVEFTCIVNNTTDKEFYIAPESIVSTLEITPKTLDFGEVTPPNTKDLQIILKSVYITITINTVNTNHPRFTVADYGGSNPPFTLNQGEQRIITVRYTAPDSGFVFSWLHVESDACVSDRVYLSAGFKDKMANNSLKLIHPNGGEEFLVGIDTVFTWEGVLPTDIVKLEYSTDAGNTWNLITDKASGLRYVWKEVPNTPSKKCLGRASMGGEEKSSCEIVIGSQIWYCKNLDVDHYKNGDTIRHAKTNSDWVDATNKKEGAWCYYNNSDSLGQIYGKLYNWYAVNDKRGLAPAGWHIPTDDEWKELEMFLGMSKSDADGIDARGTDEGGKLKSIGTIEGGDGLWFDPNRGATNALGFLALPGGWLDRLNREFSYIGYGCVWWSSSVSTTLTVWTRSLFLSMEKIMRKDFYKASVFSVRCVRD